LYRKIDHIGIAVRSLEAALKIYGAGLALKPDHIEEVPGQKTRVAIIPLGEARLELLEAMEEDSPIGKFIAKRGEGLHHVCLQVDNLEETLQRLKEAGARLIDEAPRPGANNCLVAFVHPASASGVLVELSQSCPR